MKNVKILFILLLLCLLYAGHSLTASISIPSFDKVDAVIFDCDGVLVDTEYLKFLAWQKALHSIDVELSLEEYKTLAGHTSKKIIEILENTKHISIPKEIIQLKRNEYQKLQEQGVRPIPEMVDFVHYLFQNKDILGIKLGLASSASKSEILFNLRQIGLEHTFDLIISGTDDLDDYVDPEGKNKPKPYLYLEVSKRLNISPEYCLVIEDTEAGIEAASKAGMIAAAVPNWITEQQDFSKANRVLHSISELSMQTKVFFKKDDDLEQSPSTCAHQCLQDFLHKGGVLKCISNELQIQFHSGDAVYPICSGGWCRSQALWATLKPYSEQIVLFPPHAARVGWDPYNGQINRYKNYGPERVPDEFESYFGLKKSLRFGFENDSEWKSIEKFPTPEALEKISRFYDQHYFGPESSWQGRQGKNRIYIAFSKNVHVALYRLVQSNESLKDVTVVAIDLEDIITDPPASLNTTARSVQAYEHFVNILKKIFILEDSRSLSSIFSE